MDDVEVPSFADAAAELSWYKSRVANLQDTLRDMEASLQDFTESSKEVEEAMDREIRDAEKRELELRTRSETLKGEVDDWKSKYQAAISEHNRYHAKMDKEMAAVKESQRIYKDKLREMEVSNDELENAERMIASSLSDMEGRYNKALERTALLEEELVAKSRLEEENQRLKDTLNELNEEVAILREATTVASSRGPSRTETPSERYGGNDELQLSDLLPKAQQERPASRLDRPASRTGHASVSSATGSSLRNAITRTPGAGRASFLSHARRGSRDVHNGTPGGVGGDESPSLRASRIRRDLPSATRTSTTTMRTPARPSMGPGVSRPPNSSMRMMHEMQARMRALENRINSARNVATKVLPPEEAAQSAIPRPSSRLSSSIGAGGYASPVANNTPSAKGPRPSFDGNRTIGSSIPVPPNGLSKSTSRRPGSRLSMAASEMGHYTTSASSTPPMPSVPLRSPTPLGGRGPSPLDFLDKEPPPVSSRTGGASSMSASVRRRPSVSSNSVVSRESLSARPRGSTISAAGGGTGTSSSGSSSGQPSSGGALAEAKPNRFRAPTRPASGAMGKDAAPPNAWRGNVSVAAGGARQRSGSTGSASGMGTR